MYEAFSTVNYLYTIFSQIQDDSPLAEIS